MLAILSALGLAGAVALAPDSTPAARPVVDSTSAPAASAAPLSAGPRIGPAAWWTASADTGGRRRTHAVEYSDWYARRLAVHRIASYTMLPLFAAEYVLGDRLIRQQEGAARGDDYVHGSTRNLHSVAAGAIAGLFTIHTVTGLWNLYESRHDPADRKLRTAHTILLLAADAGFVATGALAGDASENEGGSPGSSARTHRDVAIASMGVATVGTAIMWFHRD
jgi:hypothetical protein